jgi:threonine/homoserine/homoserine lactone efflux protein
MITGIHDIWLFALAAFLLAVTPGPDMALIVARSSRYGVKGGIAASLGVGAGSFVHIFAAAIGISAMLLASATAFNMIKWAGAIYLVYMGITMLLVRPRDDAARDAVLPDQKPLSLSQIFLQGALTNILNPKVAMFFLAFLPQFVEADAPSKFQAFLVLGLLMNAIGTGWNLVVAWFAARLVATGPVSRGKLWLERGMGAFFVAIGARLALVERS